ncbi:MAG: flagellar protein FlaG [Epulopiscium sp.]|nr:flagellar protein FlaG [Candidatus Epulonipiscium sp.]
MRLNVISSNSFEMGSGIQESVQQQKLETTTGKERPTGNLVEYMQQNPGYQPSIGEKVIIDAIEKANAKLKGVSAEFEFSIHEQTKQIMVKVLNAETKEVIREIPPEKILDMVAHIWELAGIFVDERR